ncbi:MAG: NAD(P)/FAD-dependent oxidoreductase [Fastidiosipilaceae bacterium]|nr:NAD(P)/FAD-dependent oxidoreductase [Clostridiaceae bacterium]
MKRTSVLIIGAGAVGCAIARELSKYDLEVTFLDKNTDVGGDASKSNSSIIHTGYDASPGTLESRLVVAANPMYDRLCKSLDVPFQRIGAILPAFNEEQFEQLPFIKEKAFQNGVYDVEYRSGEDLLNMEPMLNPRVMGGLFIPRESIIDPFVYVVALAENAVQNGAKLILEAKVLDLIREGDAIVGVKTTKGEFLANWIINASGLYCEEIARMAGKADYKVNPRRGQFYILDRDTPCKVKRIVLPIPTKRTKGKLISPMIHGNLLLGPTAEDLSDKTNHDTSTEGLASVAADVRRLVPDIRIGDTITQFSGLRPNRVPAGFNIDVYDDLAGYLNISGVRSTGLTASIAIGKYVAHTLGQVGLEMRLRDDFNPVRKGIQRMVDLSPGQRARKITEDPSYGRIICRCESVTEGEIIEAIRSPIPARSIDAIKRRLRAGMGRCQGGFCGPKVIQILARELGLTDDAVIKSDPGSNPVVRATRKEVSQ